MRRGRWVVAGAGAGSGVHGSRAGVVTGSVAGGVAGGGNVAARRSGQSAGCSGARARERRGRRGAGAGRGRSVSRDLRGTSAGRGAGGAGARVVERAAVENGRVPCPESGSRRGLAQRRQLPASQNGGCERPISPASNYRSKTPAQSAFQNARCERFAHYSHFRTQESFTTAISGRDAIPCLHAVPTPRRPGPSPPSRQGSEAEAGWDAKRGRSRTPLRHQGAPPPPPRHTGRAARQGRG